MNDAITEADRELARQAMVRGYHDCGARWQAGPGRSCDCDDSRIDGCKARVDAIAAACKPQDEIRRLCEVLKGIAEYWNGSPDSAVNAIETVVERAEAALSSQNQPEGGR